MTSNEYEIDEDKFRELNDDIDMMQRKHAMNEKLTEMGFGSYDPDLNLKRSIKSNIR
jgi:hypothetical protein